MVHSEYSVLISFSIFSHCSANTKCFIKRVLIQRTEKEAFSRRYFTSCDMNIVMLFSRKYKQKYLLIINIFEILYFKYMYQFSSVRLPSRDPMNCSMPGLPVHHQLLEFSQTHVHQIGDAIQPSHLLSSCMEHLYLFKHIYWTSIFKYIFSIFKLIFLTQWGNNLTRSLRNHEIRGPTNN